MTGKAIVMESGLSPEEQALLQMARDLGLVGQLLDQVRERQQRAEQERAYNEALAVATELWQTGIGKPNVVAVRVEVTVEIGGTAATAVYPAPQPRSRTEGGKGKSKYPAELIEMLKEESKRRGIEWYGAANALRTDWGKRLYEQWLASKEENEKEEDKE